MNLNRRTVKALCIITLALGIVSLLWLAYDYVLYNHLKPVVLGFGELGRLEQLSEFVWLSYLYLFVFHILAAGTLVIEMRYVKKIRALSIIAIAAGVFSFLGLFSDWAVLGDIGKEYKMGWDTAGEWKILYIILGIHAIFVLLVTGLSAGILRYLRGLSAETEMPAKDEIVFVVTQYVGIICGLIGIAWIAMGLIVGKNVKISVYHSISATVIILVPYGMVVSYWLILRLRDRIGDWYDEKQWRDVTRAGFTTLLLLIPSLLFFYIAFSLSGEHYPIMFLWFPFTLFVILFFFSLLTLFNYRRS